MKKTHSTGRPAYFDSSNGFCKSLAAKCLGLNVSVNDSQMKEWLTNARAGSPEDLGRLMHTCRTYLLLVANQELDQSLLAKGGASDLVQETYKHALEGFGSFKGDSAKELRSWLRTILRNHLSNLRRKYIRTQRSDSKKEISIDTVVDLDTREMALCSREPSGAERLIETEEQHILNQAMRRIRPAHRKIILLRHRDGLSFGQIAEMTGKKSTALRKLWARAIEALQSEMGSDWKHSA